MYPNNTCWVPFSDRWSSDSTWIRWSHGTTVGRRNSAIRMVFQEGTTHSFSCYDVAPALVDCHFLTELSARRHLQCFGVHWFRSVYLPGLAWKLAYLFSSGSIDPVLSVFSWSLHRFDLRRKRSTDDRSWGNCEHVLLSRVESSWICFCNQLLIVIGSSGHRWAQESVVMAQWSLMCADSWTTCYLHVKYDDARLSVADHVQLAAPAGRLCWSVGKLYHCS